MVYLFVFVPLAIWMFIDAKRRRYDAGKWWAVATALFCPVTAPVYFASRNLRKGESREGGRAWNVLKNFAIFWTVTMAIGAVGGMVNVAGSTDELHNEYERAGVTPSPNSEPVLVRESSSPMWGLKGFSDEEATQCRADCWLASAG